MKTQTEALNLEVLERLMYTFEKDGKFTMTSCIRNELFQEATNSLNQVKEALAQPEQSAEPVELLKKADVFAMAVTHGIDANTKGLYGFYIDCMSTTPPKAEQEPVAWMNKHGACMSSLLKEVGATGGEYTTPLYTAPPKPTAQNFCSRCGKRTPDLTTIHTCTPPRGLETT